MAVKLVIRRDTAANWALANPTLADGEIAHDETGGVLKVGDGTTAWVDLPNVLRGEKGDSVPGIPGPPGPTGPSGPPLDLTYDSTTGLYTVPGASTLTYNPATGLYTQS